MVNTKQTHKNHFSFSEFFHMIQFSKYVWKWKLCCGKMFSALFHLLAQAFCPFLAVLDWIWFKVQLTQAWRKHSTTVHGLGRSSNHIMCRPALLIGPDSKYPQLNPPDNLSGTGCGRLVLALHSWLITLLHGCLSHLSWSTEETWFISSALSSS